MVLSDLGSPSLATQKSSALDLCLACYSGAKSYNCAISDSYCWMVQFVANPCWMVQFVANPKRLLSRTVHSDRLTIRMAAGCASLLSSLSSKRSPRSKRLQSVCVCVKYCEIRQGNAWEKDLKGLVSLDQTSLWMPVAWLTLAGNLLQWSVASEAKNHVIISMFDLCQQSEHPNYINTPLCLFEDEGLFFIFISCPFMSFHVISRFRFQCAPRA